MGWIENAPRASDFLVEPAVIDDGRNAFPAVALAFRGPGDDSDPAISVAFVGTPKALRIFAREIQKAANTAENKSRQRQVELNIENQS